MTKLSLAFAAVLSVAALAAGAARADDPPVPAEPPAAPAAAAAPQEVKVVPPAKKICKSILRTNSRVDYIRVCLTKEEWDDVRARHRDGMDELLRAHDNPNPAGG